MTGDDRVRWRQGRKVPHHVYRQLGDEPDTRPWPAGDPPVATFLDPADAALAVEAVNTRVAATAVNNMLEQLFAELERQHRAASHGVVMSSDDSSHGAENG